METLLETLPRQRIESRLAGDELPSASVREPRATPSAEPDRGTHILIATRMDASERDAVIFALRMAAAQRARVTLLHVVAPVEPSSVHWLDAIDQLHRALAAESHKSATALDQARSDLAAFWERELPYEFRNTVEMHTECRIGDVATQIARAADELAVDLICLCDRPSRWYLPLFPGLTQQILRLSSKPIVFARPQVQHNSARL